MSICDNCIHNAVCGLEDCHEEAMTFCSDMVSKDKYKPKGGPQENGLTTYQIYLILLGYLADHDDGEMLKPMLTELYRKAESEDDNE